MFMDLNNLPEPIRSAFEQAQTAAHEQEHATRNAHFIKEGMSKVIEQIYMELHQVAVENDYLLHPESSYAQTAERKIDMQMGAKALAYHSVCERLAVMLARGHPDTGLRTEYAAQRREHQAAFERWLGRVSTVGLIDAEETVQRERQP